MKTPFEILGVEEDADDAAIKDAYLQKIKIHTPEHAPEAFQMIRQAFESIRNKRERLSHALFPQEAPDIDKLLTYILRRRSNLKRPTRAQCQAALRNILAIPGKVEEP